ncbi:UNVERIFIED_CONTAM: SAG-related sequence SRS26C [Hammondia hammondi]|eukprot:XP_008883078.1 SAG-related sequence SRS26C [Hammondia hammondi]
MEAVSLQPAQQHTVFDNNDGECQKAVKLSTLVDAELTGVTQITLGKGDATYTLEVDKAPQKQALLCYKYVAADPYENSLRELAGRDVKPEC